MEQVSHLAWLWVALGKNLEQLLNLVWLCVALSIVGGWGWRKARSGGGQLHSAKLQVVALTCLVVFLFFPISISDDLHWTTLATEGSEASRKIADKTMLRASPEANHVSGAAVIAAQGQVSASFRTAFRDRFSSSPSAPSDGFAARFSPRSPPCLS